LLSRFTPFVIAGTVVVSFHDRREPSANGAPLEQRTVTAVTLATGAAVWNHTIYRVMHPRAAELNHDIGPSTVPATSTLPLRPGCSTSPLSQHNAAVTFS
jgi:hypothetical protein